MIVAASVQTEYTGIINVCTGEPMTLGERVERFIADHHFDIKLKYGAFPDRAYDSPGVWETRTRSRRSWRAAINNRLNGQKGRKIDCPLFLS